MAVLAAMDYAFWAFIILTLVALWYIFSLFVGRSRLSMRLARIRNRGRPILGDNGSGEGSSSGFLRDFEDGLSSQNFDISINIEDGDSRPGLDSDEVRHIMETRGVSFDKARLIRQQQLMERNAIDPDTGLPLDPKAVTFGR
ncbi:hypothetical protein GGI12_005631 [Dipsacomyces acuminosporus]|nr:hypothetical protein GGI12_005631 [Dipsacomyces acuminosporus]